MKVDDTKHELDARAARLFDLLELGEVEELERELAAFQALAEALRHPSYLGYAAAARAMLALLRGDLAAAEPEIAQTQVCLRRANDPDAPRVAALQRFLLHLERGEPQRAAALVAEPPSARPVWDCLAAWALCEQGDLGRARELAVDPDDIERDEEWLAAMSALARVVVAIGDEAAARRVHDALRPFADHVAGIEAIICVGAVAHSLGLLATALGDRGAARKRLEQAIEHYERMGALRWAERARRDLERAGGSRRTESRQDVDAECAALEASR
jgi:hypothetical protein